MSIQRATAAIFFDSDSESEVDNYEDALARGYKDLLFGDDDEEEEGREEEEEGEGEGEEGEEEEEEEFYDSETGEDNEAAADDEEEEFYDSETGEDEGDSLASDDLSSCSDMSIDMEEFAGIDGVAVVAGEQVGGSGCGWYPRVDEDIEMEEVPCLFVEMVDANGGVDVVMEEVEDEDVQMEEAADMMDVDEAFW